ncbi:MAG TPA: SDR family NAD(P)-dependent oxidoreductase, partial [Polyangiaceae bacterium]|nr:SDR family NAD(P)-dependent oxidoreductase [Polyangiaceae bacterium]
MTISNELEGKVALITGAGSGIGRASAELFAAQGASVALLGRTREELAEVAEGIRQNGGRADVLVADVAHEQELRQALESLLKTFGRLDVVFANAGVNGVWAPIEELEPDEWRNTLSINLNGTFFTIKYSVPYLKRQGGSIV